MYRKKRIKIISILLSFFMVISIFHPIFIFAQSEDDKDARTTKNNQAKIHENVLEEFEEEDFVRFLVLLHEQTDIKKASLKAMQNVNKSELSKADIKLMKQKAVVNELVETATDTQRDLESFLEVKKLEGHVESFQSFYIVNGFAVTGTKETAEELAAYPEVKRITLDQQQKLTPIIEGSEVAVINKVQEASSEEIEWNVERIGAPEVWSSGITGEGIVVANLDSGVDYNHPALKTKYRGYNSEDPNNQTNEFNWYDAVGSASHPLDSDGHGTHTMGTMVGQEEEEINSVGAAPGAEWISARAFRGDTGYDSDIVEAAQWLLAPTDKDGVPHPEMAPDIINNSWGGNAINNDWFRPMVQAWRSAGIVPVFSIGNSSLFSTGAGPGTASAPGNYPESIGVGATDEEDKIAGFSLKGPTEKGGMKPDIAAPGVNIRSSIPGERWDVFDYTTYNGTSMAAPAVAATAALMLQADPSLTVDEIHNILRLTADSKTNDEYTESPNNAFGYGLLDANAAVEAVKEGVGTIHGQVIGTGEDLEAPTFEHNPREIVFIDEEAHFYIRAMDDVSVKEVTLYIAYDDGDEVSYQTYLAEGDHLDGTYETYLPSDHISGDSLEYWWVIDEFRGKQTVTDRYQVEIREAVTDGYVENFETYPDGWFSFGVFNSWEWGVPEFGPEEASSGEKVMGTNLRGNYSMSANMTLVSPPIIPKEGTQLRFNQWYSLSWFGWDKGKVFVSRDLQNWEEVYGITEENKNWHEVGVNLSRYAGEKIYIGFNLTSLDNEFPGWYIDDVQLVNNSTASTDDAIGASNVKLPFEEGERSYPALQAAKHKTTDIGEVPVDATVTVLETGWQTQASAQNGEFTIHHTPGEYTLEVEAYGFESTTETVTLEKNGEITPSISLEPLPRQAITGNIKDYAGDSVSEATVLLLEDEKIEPVKSNEDGTYSIQAYEGTYTLKAFAEGYKTVTETITVEDKSIDLDITFYPYASNSDSEIYYDNGNWSKNLVFGSEGSGFAVKMSLEEGAEAAMLKGAKLQFWAGHIPVPGGSDIRISVYDATGIDGAPGNRIAGPVDAKAVRDLYKWTEVDLSHLGIVVEDDFYILYQQTADYPYVPSFVADGDRNNAAGRSWDYFGGEWHKSDDSLGNYMIRSVVDYGINIPRVEKPAITSPEQGEVIAEKNINLEGTASPLTQVEILNNGKSISEAANVSEEGEFSIPIELTEGKNTLKVISLYEGQVASVSETVSLIVDSESPVVTITSPEDGLVTNEKNIVVEGTVEEANLDFVKINEELISTTDESFRTLVELKEGENIIKVSAGDIVGNVVTEQLTIMRYSEAPVLENVQPATDQRLQPGDTIEVSFSSDSKGGKASFSVQLPALHSTENTGANEMEEVEPGVYKGTWKVPTKTDLQGAIVEISFTDNAGNTIRETASGKLYISSEQIKRIEGSDRYNTAIEISQEGWNKSDTIILARGDDFADALAGVPLAYKLDAPILLTLNDRLSRNSLAEIKRLEAANVIVLGGKGAVSDAVIKELEAENLDVRRIDGDSRFETAAMIASEVSPKGASEVVVANGMDYPDALSVAAHAAKEGLPILLTIADRLPAATASALTDLDASETIVVGGAQVVTDQVIAKLPNAERLSGNDRYETNIALANHFGVDSNHLYVATGHLYADALTGAVLAAKGDSAIILVHHGVPASVKGYLNENDMIRLTIFGGNGAVGPEIENDLKKLLP